MAVIVPLVLLVVGAWSYRWMSDDGFINLRVVRQLLAGHGPVYNGGERVEVATSPLWIAVLAVADVLLPFRLEWIAVVSGIAFTVLGVAAGVRAAFRCAEPDQAFVLPVGAFVFAAVPAVWEFASSGLEGGLSLAWLGVTALLVVRCCEPGTARRRAVLATAVLIGLGPLVRPDFVIMTVAALGALLVWGLRDRASRLIAVAAAAVVPVCFQVFRMGFYGSLVPNTALTKEASVARWGQGWHYLLDFVGTYLLWVPLMACALLAILAKRGAPSVQRPPNSHSRVLATLAVAGVLDALYVVRVGGDFMHGRLLLPPLFAVLLPVMAVPVRRRLLSATAAVLVVCWLVACVGGLRTRLDTTKPFPHGIADERLIYQRITHHDHPIRIGDYGPPPNPHGPPGLYFNDAPILVGGRPVLTARGAPKRVYLNFSAGQAYALPADSYVVDLRGLGDWLTARFELVRRLRPGHEKVMTLPWIYARFVRDGQPVDDRLRRLLSAIILTPKTARGPDFQLEVRDAKQALVCSNVRNIEAAVRRPLTVDRFLHNIGTSVSSWNFRVPSEPAIAALCRR